MRRQAGGRIINISSNLVDSPIVPYHDYTAAKGALVGFTRSLAQEAGAWGVTVNAIAAGLTVGTDSSRATTEDMRERIIASTPLGRLATAEDIAGAVAMLAGDDAAFITGQTLHVDGGLVMRWHAAYAMRHGNDGIRRFRPWPWHSQGPTFHHMFGQ